MWCVVVGREVEHRQDSPAIKRDPAVVRKKRLEWPSSPVGLCPGNVSDSLEGFIKIPIERPHPTPIKSDTLGRGSSLSNSNAPPNESSVMS